MPLFISNVHKDVSEMDIKYYIEGRTGEKVSLLKISMKHERDYCAYKVFVMKHKINTFLDDDLWPSGITFRRFVNFSMRRPESPDRDNVGTLSSD